MTTRTRIVGLTALAAATALVAAAVAPTASARTTKTDVTAAVAVTGSLVRAGCEGGGTITLQVEASDDGYVMTASATGLAVDGRWRGSFYEGAGDSSDYIEREYRTTVVGGALSVSRTFPALNDPQFGVLAYKRASAEGDPGGSCVVFLKPARPFEGLTRCYRPYQLILTASQRANGRLVVRYQAGGRLEEGTRWNVTVTASQRDSSASVGQRETVDESFFGGKVVFRGLVNPRLRVTVSNRSGDTCSLAIRRSFAASSRAALERVERHLSPAATTRALHDLMAAQRSYVQLR